MMMIHSFLLTLLLLLLSSSLATGKEILVLTAVINLPASGLIEVTACTDITNLNFVLYSILGASYQAGSYGSGNLGNVPAGTHIIVGAYTLANFEKFFGFTPTHYVQTSQGGVLTIGTYNFKLYLKGVKVDVYGTKDFSLGWVKRNSFTGPSTTFNPSEWEIHKGAFATAANNAGASPPIQFETYQCPRPITSAPTPSPSGQPTLRPTLAGRSGNTPHDPEPDHNRPPVAPMTVITPPPVEAINVLPTVTPVVKRTPNPPRQKGFTEKPRGPTLPPV